MKTLSKGEIPFLEEVLASTKTVGQQQLWRHLLGTTTACRWSTTMCQRTTSSTTQSGSSSISHSQFVVVNRKQPFEEHPKLPADLAKPLHNLVMSMNTHPVRWLGSSVFLPSSLIFSNQYQSQSIIHIMLFGKTICTKEGFYTHIFSYSYRCSAMLYHLKSFHIKPIHIKRI